MFTAEQIKAAHSKVRSGADFPNYIREIKQLGVHYYETFVWDGHSQFHGADHFSLSTPSKYDELRIAEIADAQQFQSDLKAHQQGKSDYFTFCRQCADSGIEKWEVCLEKMTCTYFDKAGNRLLVEEIPQ